MASLALEELRHKVLELPQADRAELAHELLVSLDGQPDNGVEQAWAAEIDRRLAELDSGAVEPIDADDVSRRIRDRLSQGQ